MLAKVVFIEPNPFASRLHVLGPLIKGAHRQGLSCLVIIPERKSGPDLDSFLSSLPEKVELVWIQGRSLVTARRRVKTRLLGRMLNQARNHSDADSTVIITSPDDFVTRLVWLLPLTRLLLRTPDIHIVRYRVADFLPRVQIDFRRWSKKLYFLCLTKVAGIQTIAFDERISETATVSILPDPWSGPFGNFDKPSARSELGWDEDAFVVGLIGKQDKRKGFDVAVEALTDRRMKIPKLKVAMVGGHDAALRSKYDELIAVLGPSVHQFTDYLTDRDLAVVFAACDVVLLPYSKSFTSSSGVLVRAAASGTPVIASSHGLVGWRTLTYGLGRVFESSDVPALIALLNVAPTTVLSKKSSAQYAKASTETAVAERFGHLVSRARGPQA